MRTPNKWNSANNRRGNYNERRSYNDNYNEGIEDSYRNEDYYMNRPGQGNGYDNRDYDDRNYWGSSQREEMEWGNGNQQYVPEMNYGPWRRSPRTRATGYGNQNSRFMDEFEQWRNGPDGDRNRDNDQQYSNYARDRRDNYGRDERSRNYDRESYDRHSQGYYSRDSSPAYNYYESYPSYGQGAPYNDHERGYIDKQEARGKRGFDNDDDYSYSRRDDSGERRRFSSNEYDRRRRPMIRDKRY